MGLAHGLETIDGSAWHRITSRRSGGHAFTIGNPEAGRTRVDVVIGSTMIRDKGWRHGSHRRGMPSA
jgi:hypothetical protein